MQWNLKRAQNQKQVFASGNRALHTKLLARLLHVVNLPARLVKLQALSTLPQVSKNLKERRMALVDLRAHRLSMVDGLAAAIEVWLS